MQSKFKIKPGMGALGFLGFLGLFYFVFKQPFMISFFALFGFFSFYWEGKLAQEPEDERLSENRLRASRTGLSVGSTAVFIGMILIGNRWGTGDPETAYAILNAVVAFSFALSLNLSAYLTFRYDRDE